MITAQWAKGHGGTYRYYRCSKSFGPCPEQYVQEHAVAEQCLEKIGFLAISPEEAAFVRTIVEEDLASNGGGVETAVAKVTEDLAANQAKLNKLTRAYLDDLVDEESFQASKAELIMEKAALKHEKARLQKNSTCRWFEPTNEVITALESAGKIGEAISKGGAKSNETFLRETSRFKPIF